MIPENTHLQESIPLIRILWHTPFNRCPRAVWQADRTRFFTSGNFSTPALLCSLLELGADRILFSVDWPCGPNVPGTMWMKDLQLSAEDKTKIFSGNAKRLLKM